MTPEELKKIMKAYQLTRIRMADKLGVHQRTIYGWLSGAVIPLSMEKLIRLTFKMRG